MLARKPPAGPLRVLIASGGIGAAVHLGIDAYCDRHPNRRVRRVWLPAGGGA
ncbi:hypothetical protein ACIBF1_08760 [Spirillospora sp. NPDC050679]